MRKTKIVTIIGVAAFMLIMASQTVLASIEGHNSSEVGVYINVHPNDWPEEPLTIMVHWYQDGSLSFHTRTLMEYLGYEVAWLGEERQIKLENEENAILITVGESKCIKNGVEIEYNRFFYIVDDHSFLPHEFLWEALRLEVVP